MSNPNGTTTQGGSRFTADVIVADSLEDLAAVEADLVKEIRTTDARLEFIGSGEAAGRVMRVFRRTP